MNYTFTGHFSCGTTSALGSCLAHDNTVTLTNGGESLTLTFLGVSGTVAASSVRIPMDVGSLDVSFSGVGDFIFPAAMNPNVPLFTFFIELTTTNPIAAHGHWDASFRAPTHTSIAANCCEGRSGYIEIPVAPPPAPFTYGSVIFDNFPMPTITAQSTTIPVTATLGIVPEPPTVLLLASGLVVALAVRARPRRPGDGSGRG